MTETKEKEMDWLKGEEHEDFEFPPPPDIDDIEWEEVEEDLEDIGYINVATQLPYRVGVQICVPAVSPSEATIYIEDAGLDYLDSEGVPYTQWLVTEVRSSDPETGKSYLHRCNMRRPMTVTRLNNRLDKSRSRLRECSPDDTECREVWAKKVRFYINKLRKFPKFAPQKCFCGRFEALQSQLAREHWREILMEEWDSLHRVERRGFLEKVEDYGIRGELFGI